MYNRVMAHTFFGNSVMMTGTSSFQSVTSPNGHLKLHHRNVHVAVCGTGRPLVVAFQEKQAFVNQKLVSKNTDNLDNKRTYQKTTDGAIWYTNLLVGEKMTEAEINKFKESNREIRKEREKAQELFIRALADANRAREETPRRAEIARQATMEQARRAIEEANKARMETLKGPKRARHQARRLMEEAIRSWVLSYREAERTRKAAPAG